MAFLAFICHNSSGFGKAKIVFFGLKFGHGCVLPVFLVAGGSVHSDLLWLLCPFGVGCQLNGLCGAAGVFNPPGPLKRGRRVAA